MRIHKIRSGFANNSSSTHSIVFFKDVENVHERYSGDDFGWDEFVLKSKESKDLYFSAILSELSYEIGELNALTFMYGFFEKTLEEKSIDHQSKIIFPYSFDGVKNYNFINEFYEFLKLPNVIILGGNDNQSPYHYLSESKDIVFSLKIPYPFTYNSKTIARKNKSSNTWTIFCQHSGNKYTISFDHTYNKDIVKKVDYPELVDLKITDHCPYGCKYCYMGSTKSGTHAKFEDIQKIVDMLREWEVFEIALGGGEPTLHPQFKEIVKYIRSKNIIPNFTTRNIDFLMKEYSFINKYCGSVAISVDNSNDIKNYKKIFYNSCLLSKYSYQYVMGVNPLSDLQEALKEFNITLLGYKSTGRGKNVSPFSYEGWEHTVKNNYRSIRVDTSLLQQTPNLKDLVISESLYYIEEGAFSMYIDAVANKYGKSSYHEELFDLNYDTILDTYRSF